MKKLIGFFGEQIGSRVPEVYAHCDLFCGVYDPAQARIEAQAVYNAVEKYKASEDEIFRQRAVMIKEERAELVKHHLWVLWTDYFKPDHLEVVSDLHQLFWQATKAASQAKKTMEIKDAQNLIEAVDRVGHAFAQTKPGYSYQAVIDNLQA
ncbi:superoxide dismutase, Ni [Candidatus Saccharibacteria bacterium]|nr:superoxide dismutase, Ni [Candidatus Saccharibacteria bacterium]